jgi:two-component system, NtrC family, sensor histidine kinase KinB
VNSLRAKLTFSYGLLIVIILAVSSWGIYHFVKLGRAIDVILVNNYKSISAAANMKEALERQDSTARFFITGHTQNARQRFQSNGEDFGREFDVAANNITEPGETEIVGEIRARYQEYKKDLERFLARPQSGELSGFYFERLEPEFLALKDKLDDLLRLNQQAMFAANDRAIAFSKRGEISTAVTAALALTVALLFAWRFSRSVAEPISVLAGKAKRVGEGDFDQHMSISSKDEIGVLATEFNRMLVRLRELRKSDYGRLLIEQKKSDAVIDSIGEPVLVTDARGRLIKVNRAARLLLGDSANGDRRDSDLSLSDLSGGERILRAVHDVVSMQRPVGDEEDAATVPIKLGGSDRDFRLRATPMRDSEGRLVGAVTLLEDITAITEVDKVKTEFISIASSKLREPLHALQLALHAVAEGYAGEVNEHQNELLASARENAENLDELIDDLLQLAEIESGARRLSPQRLRPVDLARAAIERFRPAADSKEIKLENKVWPDLSWVMGDGRAIATIFDNLLSNAIRHTYRGGTITVEGTEHVGRVYFSVRDTGEGIPEQYLPTIFGRFVQVGERAEGTGLGLALVKRLVEAQGGQVSVNSSVGEGSTFTFALITGGPASVRSLE